MRERSSNPSKLHEGDTSHGTESRTWPRHRQELIWAAERNLHAAKRRRLFLYEATDGSGKLFAWNAEREAYFLMFDAFLWETKVVFTCLQSDMEGCIKWGWAEYRKHVFDLEWILIDVADATGTIELSP